MTPEDLKVEILRCFYGLDWKDLNKVVEPFLAVAERYAQSELSEANKEIEKLKDDHFKSLVFISDQGVIKGELEKEIERLKEQNETLKAGINQILKALITPK